MMHAKVPAPAKHAQSGMESAGRRSAPSPGSVGADFIARGSQAASLQHVHKITTNSSRVKQLGKMQMMRDGAAARKNDADQGRAPGRDPAQFSSASRGRGLPQNLKDGIESLSGISMDDVTVHYNSPQPAGVQARAFAKGRDIHLGPGQEAHLPHEAWHVVQQAQGRVATTMQMAGAAINDDAALEREADVMGARASAMSGSPATHAASIHPGYPTARQSGRLAGSASVLQRKTGMEIELHIPFYGSFIDTLPPFTSEKGRSLSAGDRASIMNFLFGSLEYAGRYGEVKGEYDITADHMPWPAHSMMKEHILEQYLGGAPKSAQMSNSMSNLEYRTVALQEDARYTPAMKAIADSITAHAIGSSDLAISGASQSLPRPVYQSCRTGIPMSALTGLLSGDEKGMKILEEMRRTLIPHVYYQTSTGVLPSEIPGLFSAASESLDTARATVKDQRYPAFMRMSMASRLLTIARESAARAMVENAEDLGSFNEMEKNALVGWLTLLAQYLTASCMENTNYAYAEAERSPSDAPNEEPRVYRRQTHSKNLIPYLSRTNLSQTIYALPEKARPKDNALWNNFFDELFEMCKSAVGSLYLEPPAIDGMGPPPLADFSERKLAEEFKDPKDKEKRLKEWNKQRLVLWMHAAEYDKHPGLDGQMAWLRALVKNAAAKDFKSTLSVITGTQYDIEEGVPNDPIASKEQVIPLEDRYATQKLGFLSNGVQTGIHPRHIADVLMLQWENVSNMRTVSIKRIKKEHARESKSDDFDDDDFLRSDPLPSSLAEVDSKEIKRDTTSHMGSISEQIAKINEMLLPLTYIVDEFRQFNGRCRGLSEIGSGANDLYWELLAWKDGRSDQQIAIDLIKHLLKPSNWDTKGKALLGSHTPDGVKSLQKELAGDSSEIKLADLRKIAQKRIGAAGRRRATVTTQLYELVRDASAWIDANDWKSFSEGYAKVVAGLK